MVFRTSLLIYCSLLLTFAVFGQQKAPKDSTGLIYETRFPFSFQISGGITNFQFGQVRDNYEFGLVDFGNAGLVLDNSDFFPASPIFEVELLFHIKDKWRMGGVFGFSKTESTSRYNGSLGTLDISDKLSMWSLTFDARRNFGSSGKTVPYLGARVGLFFGADNYAEEIDLTLSAQDSLQTFERSGSGIGPQLQLYGGLQQYFGNFFASFSAGYRLAIMPGMQGDLKIGGQAAGSGSFLNNDGDKLVYDYSGFVLRLGIGYSLF